MESPSDELVDIEECFQKCGSLGRYQISVQVLFAIFILTFGCIPYLPVFVNHDPAWTCTNRTLGNMTTTLGNTTTTTTNNEFCRHHVGKEISPDDAGFGERCKMGGKLNLI